MVFFSRKTTGKKTVGGTSNTVDQQEDMETTDIGNGIQQEHTESIVKESKANIKGTNISYRKQCILICKYDYYFNKEMKNLYLSLIRIILCV